MVASGTATGLRYVTDRVPGITRRRVGRNGRMHFIYTTAAGRTVRDRATLTRIGALAIPPAYEEVWICADPRGHLQATGRDARGRKQYRYHAAWRRHNDEAKHARMAAFGRALPQLRRNLRADLAKPGLPREKVLALVVGLLDKTCARVGNPEYARTNGSFGLTTLKDRHARVTGRRGGTLRFPGKGGTLHEVPLADAPHLARLVRRCQQLPGQHLFQYLDEEGRRHEVDSGQVNAYLRSHLGEDFSAKDFRTWHATRRAYELLLSVPRPDPCTDRACREAIHQVVCQVAEQLRNTPAVCRKSYINPVVFEAWQAGRAPFRGGPRRHGNAPLLALLQRAQASPTPAPGGKAGK